MGTLVQDFRYAVRVLWKARGVSGLCILILALGIGGTTSIFSVVSGVLLRPLPWSASDQLRVIRGHLPGVGFADVGLTEGEFVSLRAARGPFDAVAMYVSDSDPLVTGGEGTRLHGALVTHEMLSILGGAPQLGRDFTGADEVPGAAEVALISDSLWRQRFNAAPDAVGRSMSLDGKTVTVVGVLPAGFSDVQQVSDGRRTDLWMPLTVNAAAPNFGNHNRLVLGRLGRTTTPAAADAFLASEAREIARANASYFPDNMHYSLGTKGLADHLVGDVRGALLLLLAAVSVLLIIACANIANLLLAKAEARDREIAVRLALGATRPRLMRQLLTESVLLALIGGAAGLVVTLWLSDVLPSLIPDSVPRVRDVTVDPHVLAFAALTSVLTGILFGLAPAVRLTRSDLQGALKQSAGLAGGSRRPHRLSEGLVVAEIALALALLTSAGLLMRSFWRMHQVDVGFSTDQVLTMSVPLDNGLQGRAPTAFYQELLARTATVPGVASAALVEPLPLSGSRSNTIVHVQGRPWDLNAMVRDVPHSQSEFKSVSAGYLELMGIPLLRGRGLRSSDTAESPPVVVVNDTFAKQFFPHEDALGHRIQLLRAAESLNPYAEIVGVARDAKNVDLIDPVHPEVYVPDVQYPNTVGLPMRSMTLVVRTTVPPLSVAGGIRREIAALSSDVAATDVRTLEDVVAQHCAEPRFQFVMFGAFAALALLLGTVGIYGMMSYWVSQRTRELGVRMALGAAAADVIGLVVGQGGRLLLAGGAIGVALSFGAGLLLRSSLFGVGAFDLPTTASVLALLGGAGLLAVWAPARRATRVDPVEAIRQD